MIRENAHIPYPVAENSNVPLTLPGIQHSSPGPTTPALYPKITMIRENAHIPYPVAENSNVPLTLPSYGYCSPDQARAALSSVQGYDEWVHSIFWAASFSDTVNVSYPDSPGRIGCFLFTKEKSWKQ